MMKHKIIITLVFFLLGNNCSFAQNRNKKSNRQQKNNNVRITPSHYDETIVADNEQLLFQEYSCKANFKTKNENGYYPSYLTREVNIEWPCDWRGHNLDLLQKALLSWMWKLWTGNSTIPNQFNSVDDVLKTYCVKGCKTFHGHKDLTNYLVKSIPQDKYPDISEHRFECRYISNDICIYEHVYVSEYCREGNVNYFYYDIKNNKILTIDDLIASKSDAVQAIVNEYNKIINYNDKNNDSRYANDYYKKKIESLRRNGFKDIFIEKENITFVYDFKDDAYTYECYAVIPTPDVTSALSSRVREIIDNMPLKQHQLMNNGSSRPIVGVLTLYKDKENLNDYTKQGDLIKDSNCPTGRVIDYSPTKFKIEDDNTGEFWYYYLPKTKVTVEEYGYNELLLSDIGERIAFISNDRKSKITILKYDSNGHRFKDDNFNEGRNQKSGSPAKKEIRQYEKNVNQPKYVLCYELKDQGVWFVPLKIEDDHVCLYTNNDRYNCGLALDVSSVRYKSHAGIHFLDYGAYGYYNISSFFDKDGRMTNDVPYIEYIPEDISIAYFHDLQKLYFNGEFYTLYENVALRTGESSHKNSDDDYSDNEIHRSAASMPQFPGGNRAMINFINTHLKYPKRAQDNNIQGKVVVIFVVEKNGAVGEVRVVTSVDKDLDDEAKRICKIFPKFSPGKNANGDPVRVWFTLPIHFKLQGAN